MLTEPCPRSRRALFGATTSPAVLIAILLASGGCGSGGGGGGNGGAGGNQTSIGTIDLTPSASGTVIEFTTISSADHDVSVAVEFSQDRGRSYSTATLSSGDPSELEASAGGVAQSVTWNPGADLEEFNQSDFRIRLTPTDRATDEVGSALASEVFGLGTNNAPVAHTVTTPTGTQGGAVPIAYTVSDAEADTVGIRIAYSTDSGVTWIDGSAASGGDGADAVTTATTPVSRLVYWDAQSDIAGTTSSAVRVRITPIDVIAGTSVDTGDFTVNLLAPEVTLLTVGEVPADMNGSESYVDSGGDTVSWRVSASSDGFRITVNYAPVTGGGAVASSTLSVTSDTAFGSFAAGDELAGEFTIGSSSASWGVPSSRTPSAGLVTLSATVEDTYGNVSAIRNYEFRVVTSSSAYRPFSTQDAWYLDFTTDYFTIDYSGTTTITITTSATSDGTADFLQDLEILGLRSASPTTACQAIGSNTILRDWVITESIGRLNELYGKSFDGSDSGFHSNLVFQTTASGARSTMRIGGDDAISGYTLGRAQFDSLNAAGNFDSSTSLGVFVTNMTQFYINSSYTFKSRFDALIPGRGTPAGEDALDYIVLDEDFNRLDSGNSAAENARYDEVYDAIDALARSIAVIAGHEIGHSIGLCANDPLPTGLFGGASDAPFAGVYTTDYHLDTSGNNVMAAALSFSASLITTSSGYRFNELCEAYLREWILLHQ